MSDPVVELTGLTIRAADRTPLVEDAHLPLLPGQVTALTGPSGSGKTTLLRAVLGVLPPGTTLDAGHARVLGRDVFALGERDLRLLRRHHLAYVGQDPASALNPRIRVGSLLREVAADRSPRAMAALLTEVRLPEPERLQRRRPTALSGGQQRRVALARALGRRPDVLLLDEPMAGLDPALRAEMGDLLRHVARERGVAVALSCHDAELVARIADETVALGPPEPAAAPPRPRPRRPARREPRSDPPLLAVRGLGAAFGRGARAVPVLHDIDLTVAPGEAVGVVGASGAGKTTLVRTIVGLHPIAAGTVTLGGLPLPSGLRGRPREQRRRLQLIPQDPLGALNPSRTIGATLGRPLRLHRRAAPADMPTRVAELLAQVGLPEDFARRYPHQLSGGQRQRVSIARALAADPDVLVCDEVTSALDDATATSVMDLLTGLREQRGLALILISHNLPLVADRTDTVTVLATGRAVESGPTREVLTTPAHPATAALLP
ncbi:ABC transporter ATP-binding protein [Streptomyces litchfieldiae]|uniref:ATP-binding cassette domain-containing protein n=1 Tax=Streptomyces litchfieldiae TaxID=3075543 RepID=A0ABU2MZ82_9ACTN|nr:ATP-binding cassette domain-containing protein [Streptomyces sp. DSM 44938]MDT0346955.1 ATP-binding cassette domain-containing protein [Streptomyces sp. DSM 44938]